MKELIASILFFLTFVNFYSTAESPNWNLNIDSAKIEAVESDKLILIYFAGSDWCKPCIQLRRDVFETDSFRALSEDHFVLVYADFPRLKKNKPGKEQIAHNEMLAEQYNSQGVFPFVVILNPDGQAIKSIEYTPDDNDYFMKQLESLIN